LSSWTDPLEQFLAGQLSARTRLAYAADLRDFFGTLRVTLGTVRDVTFEDVIAYRNELAERGCRRTTINRKLSSLKSFYRMVTAAGLVERNPADPSLVRGYRVEETLSGKAIAANSLRRILEEVATVDNELVRDRDSAVLQVLTYGGLRRSEAAGMNWEHIRQEGVFYVLSLPDTKAGVPQDIKLQPVVMHYLEQYAQTLKRYGYSQSGPVFLSLSRNASHGSRLTAQSINLIVKRHALRAGVPSRVTAHMFRHTCCTLAIEGGAKPQQVQAHLRHKDLKTTMRYYENRERLLDNASDYIRVGSG
jgi:integrase/recombinase XerC